MAGFLDMLDASIRQFGVAEGLPRPLHDAVIAVPRHRFVHRFRIADGPLQDADAAPKKALPVIYSDAVMRHVTAEGALLPSSNSQPSYVLFLLHLLGLTPGQAVLEIGSGSGWLAAVMAQLVGPTGRVTGIELIADLAAQSRADLAACGIERVEIITGDGAAGHAAAAPFDRAIVTASTWDLPWALFDQVAEGGKILAPIELRSGDGCDVTVFRRQGAAFIAERAVPGWFVPLRGEQQDRSVVKRGAAPSDDPVSRFALPLGVLRVDGPMPLAAQFRAFLGRTEPDFVSLRAEDDSDRGRPVAPFGIADPADGSLALWRLGYIERHGGPGAAHRLARAYAHWAELGMPGLAAFQLEVHRAESAPKADDERWIERRGRTALVWRIKREGQPWNALLAAMG